MDNSIDNSKDYNVDKYGGLLDKENYGLDDLASIMGVLMSPEGCPWDRKQTHESLKRYLIEEAYEALEAIDMKDDGLLCEELGDVLLQVVFHACVSQAFSIGDVVNGICRKLISRHTHVFGDVKAATAEDALSNWESNKRKEKGAEGHAAELKRVPANLPALMRAYKVQQKARDAGFDWDEIGPVFEKAGEELAELKEAVAAGDAAAIENEMGDLLFASVNLSRFVDTHPEQALGASTDKFVRRFDLMEKMIESEGRRLSDMTMSEMDVYWERAKKL